MTGVQALASNADDISKDSDNERDNMRGLDNISECDTGLANLSFKEAIDLPEIETISRLADEIWHDHYMPIIGAEQMAYMLKQFQNVNAVGNQIRSGYRYYLLRRDKSALAYFAVLPNTQDRSLHISKLFVRKSWQRKGLGSRMLAFIEHYVLQNDLDQIWLTVNRHNQQAIDFYFRNKFVNAGNLVQDIGGGFVMDDFKMVKNLK
jgi:ribosomal protein S18 acetylase RimI-like enzyme